MDIELAKSYLQSGGVDVLVYCSSLEEINTTKIVIKTTIELPESSYIVSGSIYDIETYIQLKELKTVTDIDYPGHPKLDF